MQASNAPVLLALGGGVRVGPELVARLGLAPWAEIALLLGLAVLVALALSAITTAILRRLAARTEGGWDDEWAVALAGPIRLTLLAAILHVTLGQLEAPPRVASAASEALRAALLLGLFWGLYRSVSVLKHVAAASAWATDNPGSVALISLGGRLAQLAVLAVGAIAVLSSFGFPVASLVAGAGFGGLAIGLAAQKTIENLFGGFSLAVDWPCRAGDFVRVENVVGTVETVGIRSTRVRTLDRTLVTIPNAKLSETPIETYAARDRIRLSLSIGLEYGTTQAQMRQVLTNLEGVLRGHPKIWPDTVNVRFAGFGASSLDIDIMAWFQTTDFNEFLVIRQEMFLAFMGVVEAAGTSFAFPTRTLHIASGGIPARA